MADLNKSLETMMYDVRMRDFNVKQGHIKKEDLEKHLKSISDSSASCEPVTLEDKEDFE